MHILWIYCSVKVTVRKNSDFSFFPHITVVLICVVLFFFINQIERILKIYSRNKSAVRVLFTVTLLKKILFKLVI